MASPPAKRRRRHSRIGRPTKLTPHLQRRIVRLIRNGNYIETSCAAVGIDKRTLYNWLNRANAELDRMIAADERCQHLRALERHAPTWWADARAALTDRQLRESEAIYVEFLYAIEEACAQAESADLLRIRTAANVDWRAAAWRLERRTRDRWGPKVDVDATIGGKAGQPIEHIHRVRVYIPDNGRQPLPADQREEPRQLRPGKTA